MVRKNPASLRYHLLRSVPSGSTHRDVFQRKLKLYLTLAVEFGNIEESSLRKALRDHGEQAAEA